MPYSVEEVYGIRESGKYATIKQTYNELYRIYGTKTLPGNVLPAKVLVEDSNAGYDFYCGLSQNKKWTVESADGRNRVVNIFPDFKTKTRSFTPQT